MNSILPQRPGTPMPGTGFTARPQSPALAQPTGNYLYRVWKWIQQFLYDYCATIAYGIGLIAGGILVAPAIPALMLPCIGLGIGLMTSALVTKSLKRYNFVPLTNLQNFSVNLGREYPQVHIIAFATTVFIASACPPAGFAAGLAIGLVSGFTTHQSMLNGQRGLDNSGRMRRGISANTLASMKA